MTEPYIITQEGGFWVTRVQSTLRSGGAIGSIVGRQDVCDVNHLLSGITLKFTT